VELRSKIPSPQWPKWLAQLKRKKEKKKRGRGNEKGQGRKKKENRKSVVHFATLICQ